MESQPDYRNINEEIRAAEAASQASVRISRPPLWYYPGMGLLMAGMSLMFTFGDTLVQVTGVLGAILLGRLLDYLSRQVSGTQVGGLHSGRATRWSIAWIVVVVGATVGGWQLSEQSGSAWPGWISAAVIFVLTLLYGAMFQRSRRGAVGSR